jgi:hypothetical protein
MIYFYPESDKFSGPSHTISAETLKEKLRELIDPKEEIKNIWVYQCPLSNWQLTQWLLYHAFVVLETDAWWWSIEKNTEGITIQRSKKNESVKDRYRQEPRPTPIYRLYHDEGRMLMGEFIDWLNEAGELFKEYHWIWENCKEFAERLFDNFANSEVALLI